MNDPHLKLAYTLAQAARQRLSKRRPRTARPAKLNPQLSPAQRVGQWHEDLALDLLQRAGLTLLARNLRCRAGEIDLILREADVLVLVEVRARANPRFGGAAASISPAKQARLARAAAMLLPEVARRHWIGSPPRVRFDVVAFEQLHPHWLRAAFWLEAGP